MSCPVGRDNCDPAKNAVCKSMVSRGECTPHSVRKRKAAARPVMTWHKENRLFTTKYFYSVNHWHGRPRYVYLNYKKEWLSVLAGTWALWGNAKGKRRVIIYRQVSASKKIISDFDNLVAGCKPILDILTQQGVIQDDTTDDIELHISQGVGIEDIVEIKVEDI